MLLWRILPASGYFRYLTLAHPLQPALSIQAAAQACPLLFSTGMIDFRDRGFAAKRGCLALIESYSGGSANAEMRCCWRFGTIPEWRGFGTAGPLQSLDPLFSVRTKILIKNQWTLFYIWRIAVAWAPFWSRRTASALSAQLIFQGLFRSGEIGSGWFFGPNNVLPRSPTLTDVPKTYLSIFELST